LIGNTSRELHLERFGFKKTCSKLWITLLISLWRRCGKLVENVLITEDPPTPVDNPDFIHRLSTGNPRVIHNFINRLCPELDEV
jgi:hypothetical protein